jgi:hypothetical protein
MPENKGLNRGGSLGQEGELPPDGDSPEAGTGRNVGQPGAKGALDKRDEQKQRGGIDREPSLEDKQKIQPTHEVD